MLKLDAIGIVAKDIKKSIKFYKILGLKFTESSGDHVEALATSGIRIMLDSESLIKKLNPKWVKPVGQRTTLAFLCDSPKEVDKTFNKMTKAGYKGHVKPWNAFWGQRYASVLDPDGNAVDLFAALEST